MARYAYVVAAFLAVGCGPLPEEVDAQQAAIEPTDVSERIQPSTRVMAEVPLTGPRSAASQVDAVGFDRPIAEFVAMPGTTVPVERLVGIDRPGAAVADGDDRMVNVVEDPLAQTRGRARIGGSSPDPRGGSRRAADGANLQAEDDLVMDAQAIGNAVPAPPGVD